MSFSKLRRIISDVASFIYDKMPWNWKYYPEWLRSMQGDSPLLGRPEWDFIADVRYSIIQEANSMPDIPYNQHLEHKLSVMKDNFEKVVKHLKENSQSNAYFVHNYSAWRNVRNQTILRLKNIAKAININSQEAAATRGVGSSVSLVGGLMCLVPGGGALRIAGSVLMGLGSLASAGISFLELEVLRKKIKEAEKVMLEDKIYAEELWNWISDLSQIQEAYDIIRNIDVDIDLRKIASELHACFKANSTSEEVNIIIRKFLNALKVSRELKNEIADVIGILIATFMLYDRYRRFFNLTFETFKCKKILRSAFNTIATSAIIASAVYAGKNAKISNFQKNTLVIGIVLDILSIIHAAKDMNSVAKEAVEIAKAAEKLKEEAVVFENLYNAVRYARVQ